MKGNYVVLDCETGGLKATENPITQIALMGLDHKTGKEICRYESYIKPYNDFVINPVALSKTMVDINDVMRGADLKDVVKNIIEFCKKVAGGKLGQWTAPIIVGHNVSFDIAFIEVLFYLANKEMTSCFANNNGITYYRDTQQMARDFWPNESSIKLGDCCERAGIRLVDAHGAMNDVIATKNLFVWYRTQIQKLSGGASQNQVDSGQPTPSQHRKFFSI